MADTEQETIRLAVDTLAKTERGRRTLRSLRNWLRDAGGSVSTKSVRRPHLRLSNRPGDRIAGQRSTYWEMQPMCDIPSTAFSLELSEADQRVCLAAYTMIELLDLVDVDRDAIRDAILCVEQFSNQMIGEELTLIDDRQAIEDKLAETYEID